jgi:hypothetical protein
MSLNDALTRIVKETGFTEQFGSIGNASYLYPGGERFESLLRYRLSGLKCLALFALGPPSNHKLGHYRFLPDPYELPQQRRKVPLHGSPAGSRTGEDT